MGERADEVRYDDLADDTDYEEIETDGTAEIRSNIEQTRSEMSGTIEAIQARLAPDHLKEQVKEQVREQFEEAKSNVREATIGKAETMMRNAGDTVSEARYTVMDTIRHNPIPAALVGIGLGWLFMNGRSASARGSQAYRTSYNANYYSNQYPERYYTGQSGYSSGSYANQPRSYEQQSTLERGQQAVGNTVQNVQDKAGDVASKVQDTVGDLAGRGQEAVGNIVDQAQSTAGDIAYQAQHQAQRVEDRFQRALGENPLAVGAIALAVGAAVGLAVPQTRRENELMGEARDNLVERAQSVAQDTMEKVQEVAGQAMEQAETTVKEQAREKGLTGS